MNNVKLEIKQSLSQDFPERKTIPFPPQTKPNPLRERIMGPLLTTAFHFAEGPLKQSSIVTIKAQYSTPKSDNRNDFESITIRTEK